MRAHRPHSSTRDADTGAQSRAAYGEKSPPAMISSHRSTLRCARGGRTAVFTRRGVARGTIFTHFHATRRVELRVTAWRREARDTR